jgi:P pilus assembly chaperone PapD
MNLWTRSILAAGLFAAALLPTSAGAGVGDLLVAPTRLVLDGRKGAEIILNNIGDEPATYRVSVEFRRMTEKGDLVEVPTPSVTDKAAEDMIIYAPRKVTLAPHEPQAIRIVARAPQGLPDGEYRVHMLFRAIPPPTPVVQPTGEQPKGVQFQLTPVYGVTIPVIIRLGNLDASAGIANVQLERRDSAPAAATIPMVRQVKVDASISTVTVQPEEKASGVAIGLDLTRTGTRSTYGEVRVLKAGVRDPIAIAKGIAIYTEVGKRHVSIPIAATYKGALTGPITVEYVETFDDGRHLLASTQAVLR